MEAVIILQRCGKHHRTFGNRVQRFDDDWYRTWAFPISENRAKAEGYDQARVQGNLYGTEEFPGCPYCGTKGFVQCHKCGRISCWNGEKTMDCPWCGIHFYSITTATSKMDFTSGGDL